MARKFDKVIYEDYPFCYIYNPFKHRKIEKWLKLQKISHKFHWDGNDPHDYFDGSDTVSFKNQDDALAFELAWKNS